MLSSLPKLTFGLATALVLSGCATTPVVPPARPVIISSGVRLNPTQPRMEAIAEWVDEQLDHIDQDPGFLIITTGVPQLTYPWETVEVKLAPRQDTARVSVDNLGADSQTAYLLYAHLKLMEARGDEDLEEWLPGAAGTEGLEREMLILSRVAEAWLYGRSVFAVIPHPVWDEIMYAYELGYLREMLLVARPEEFAQEREAWLEENPAAQSVYAEWFRTTFDREPPGMRDPEEPAG